MDKVGQLIMAKEIPKILFYMVFLVIVSFVIIFNVNIFSQIKIMDNVLEEHVPLSMIWGSSDCFAYSEKGRVFRGIIDLEKVNEERLEKCFDSVDLGVRVKFYEFRGGIDQTLESNKAMLAKGILCDMDNSNLNCFKNRKYVIFKGKQGSGRGIMDLEVVSLDQ